MTPSRFLEMTPPRSDKVLSKGGDLGDYDHECSGGGTPESGTAGH
jgi:hypothetical protein